MQNILTFIPEQLLILVAAIYTLGIFLKKIESVQDKYIVIFLMIFAISFSLVLVGFNANAILQGILCWGVSVGINQTAKQLIKEDK